MGKTLGVDFALPVWAWIVIAWGLLTAGCFWSMATHRASTMFDFSYAGPIWFIGTVVIAAFAVGALL